MLIVMETQKPAIAVQLQKDSATGNTRELRVSVGGFGNRKTNLKSR